MTSKDDPDGTVEPGTPVGSSVRRRTLRRMRQLLATGVAVGVYACDGPVVADPLPPPPSSTIPADSASLEVTVLSAARVSSSSPGQLLAVELQIEEYSGSVGANIDFVRAELLRSDDSVEERQELGADTVIAILGSNRIEAGQRLAFSFTVTFKARIDRQAIRITVGFTDDRGTELSLPNTFVLA